MKHPWIILYILAGLNIFFACQSNLPYPEAMEQAEKCMLQHPDSALIYLASLDSTIGNEPKETRMYHALLTIKAKDKLYIPHTSDSLIKPIVHFYETYGDTDKLMEAYYYWGCVYQDMKDVPRAVTAYQQAAETGKNSRRYDILGRIYEHIGMLFAYQSLYEDAMSAYKTSYAYYLKQQEDRGLMYALRDIGRMYESLQQPDSAEYYYQAAYKKAFDIKDQRLINSISVEFGDFCIELGKPDSAKKIFSRIPAPKEDAIYLMGIGSIFQLNSQPDSALFYYRQALQEDKKEQNIYLKSRVNKNLSEIEAQKGNYRAAFTYAWQSLNWKDSIKKITRTEAIGKIHALYNYQHTEKENERLLLENEHKRNQIYLLIIGLLLSIGVVAFYINYNRKQKQAVREQQKRLLRLKDEQYKKSLSYIQEKEKEIAELEILLQQTEGEKDSLQNKLLLFRQALLKTSVQQAQMEKGEKDVLIACLKKSDIYRSFHQAAHVEGNVITEKMWKELGQMLDTTYCDFTSKLYEFYPRISEHELHVCYLIKIEVPIKDIAKLLNRSTPAISNCRSRLYKKLQGEEGNGDNFDTFILSL